MGRVLAIDYGEKRLGIAISDKTKKIAFPKPYLAASKRDEIIKLAKEFDVEKILIGFPVNLKGERTAAGQKVNSFEEWIKKNIKLSIELNDERYSTKEIQNELGKSSRGRELIDSLVAQRMLERYLEKIKK